MRHRRIGHAKYFAFAESVAVEADRRLCTFDDDVCCRLIPDMATSCRNNITLLYVKCQGAVFDARGRPPSEEAKRKALRAAHEILINEGSDADHRGGSCAPALASLTITALGKCQRAGHGGLDRRYRGEAPPRGRAWSRSAGASAGAGHCLCNDARTPDRHGAGRRRSGKRNDQGVPRTGFCCQAGKWGGRFCNPQEKSRSSRRADRSCST